MFNPFGEDDDDYEMNMFIDQYMKVSSSFLLVFFCPSPKSTRAFYCGKMYS